MANARTLDSSHYSKGGLDFFFKNYEQRSLKVLKLLDAGDLFFLIFAFYDSVDY